MPEDYTEGDDTLIEDSTETEEDAEAQADAIEAQVRAKSLAAAQARLALADKAIGGSDFSGTEMVNRAATASADGSVMFELSVHAGDDPGLDQRAKFLEAVSKSIKDVSDVYVERAKAKNYAQIFGISTLGLGTLSLSIVTLILEENHRNTSSSPPPTTTPPGDSSEIPQELKDVIEDRAKAWRAMSLADAMENVKSFVTTYKPSLQAQFLLLRDLGLLVGKPKLVNPEWDGPELVRLSNLADAAWAASTSDPKTAAIYEDAKAWEVTNPGEAKRALTLSEACYVCALALSVRIAVELD